MTAETHALRERRKVLLEQLSRAADEIKMILMNELEKLRAKRLELIKNIAATADQIAALDCEIEAIQMNLLEEDLNRQQEAVA